MKKLLLVVSASVLLAGCQIQENYAVQYRFTAEPTTAVVIAGRADGFTFEVPFADFSCDATSFKAQLTRSGDTITMVLSGTETAARCSQQFSGTVTGLPVGSYQLRIVYDTGGSPQTVVSQTITVGQ